MKFTEPIIGPKPIPLEDLGLVGEPNELPRVPRPPAPPMDNVATIWRWPLVATPTFKIPDLVIGDQIPLYVQKSPIWVPNGNAAYQSIRTKMEWELAVFDAARHAEQMGYAYFVVEDDGGVMGVYETLGVLRVD